MSRRTPGPWMLVDHSWSDTSVWAGDEKVCHLSIYEIATSETQEHLEMQMDANARLIAAAPDLLEALQVMLNFDDETAHEIAHKAIAKATGETP